MRAHGKNLLYSALTVICIAFILLTAPLFVQSMTFLLTQVFGLLLIGWAILAMRLNKTHHAKNLPKSIFLVTKGPYEIIRHPVYAGLLLIMSSYVQEYLTFSRFLVFVVLLVVTVLKINYEESLLEEHMKEYTSYKAKTHRIIPYFY